METTIVCWGYMWGHSYVGIMEHQMETAIVCWGYIGRMEKRMEAPNILGESCASARASILVPSPHQA